MRAIITLLIVILCVCATSQLRISIKPNRPFIPRPFRTWGKCCTEGTMYVGLYGTGSSHGYVPGVGKPTFTQQSTKNPCDTMALLKVNFQALSKGCGGCQREPVCGRRMLQVDLYLHPQRNNYLFNIGDSKTNNGYGGDSGTNSNDAEIQGYDKSIGVYKSDKCKQPKPRPPLSHLYSQAIGTGVDQVRLYISNEFVRIQNNKGFDRQVCSDCLFALNGQPDKEAKSTNYDIYVALNRVIANTSRRGYGTCLAKIKWVCPCDY